MDVPYHLSPTMVSRKLQALRFIKAYFREWGGAPSLGEISSALDLRDRQHARDVVAQLVAEGKITRRQGRRGIGLPNLCDELCNEDLLRELRERGIHVNAETDWIGPTKNTLPAFPEIPHLPCGKPGESHDRDDGSRGSL